MPDIKELREQLQTARRLREDARKHATDAYERTLDDLGADKLDADITRAQSALKVAEMAAKQQAGLDPSWGAHGCGELFLLSDPDRRVDTYGGEVHLECADWSVSAPVDVVIFSLRSAGYLPNV